MNLCRRALRVLPAILVVAIVLLGAISPAPALVWRRSALFKEMPEIDHSSVELEAGNLSTLYISSKGTEFRRVTPSVVFRAPASTQASDGMPLNDFVAEYAKSIAGLPKEEELASRIREMGMRLEKVRAAALPDRYTGPVLFEGQAAAELFSQVMVPAFLAARRPVSDNPQLEMAYAQMGNSFEDRLGSRVLPESLDVINDPTVSEFRKMGLLGSYKVDDDGIRARETQLVDKGILKTLLTTRTMDCNGSKWTNRFLSSVAALGMIFCIGPLHKASAKEEAGFVSLFDGKDLEGWHMMGHEDWHAENGILWTEGKGGWVRSDKLYADFILRLEYRTSAKSNSGIFLRAAEAGNPAFTGMEIQILDDAGKSADVHGSASIYGAVAPRHNAAKPAGEWNQVEISCVGRHVAITLNGHRVQDANLDDPQYEHAQTRPLSKVPDRGYIGLQSHTNRVDFRNLRIKVL